MSGTKSTDPVASEDPNGSEEKLRCGDNIEITVSHRRIMIECKIEEYGAADEGRCKMSPAEVISGGREVHHETQHTVSGKRDISRR